MNQISIQKSALGNLIQLGKGGQGTVFKVSRAQLTLQSKAFGEVVYKEYHGHKLKEVNASVLREMVAFLSSLSFANGTNLVARVAWPVCLVEEGSDIVGYLMPCIPPQFTINLRLPSGLQRVEAGFQLLLNDHKYLSDQEITLTDADRYKLLYELAVSIRLFHSHKIAIGDLSPKNALFCLSPASVYFVDCDSMRYCGKDVLPQGETPFWGIREFSSTEELATPETDNYKFGLFVLRLFAGHQMTKDSRNSPASVPNEIRSMVADSLSQQPRRRPGMDQWLSALDKMIQFPTQGYDPKKRKREEFFAGLVEGLTLGLGRRPNRSK